MIKAVIFDLDNTLIDFLKLKRMCCEKAISAMVASGLEISKQKSMKILYSLYSKYGIENPTIFQKFLEQTTGKVDYQKLARAINAYRRARIGVLTPYPGVKNTLTILKKRGLKLAIVSDAPKLNAWLRLTGMELDDFFDVVVAFEDTGREKPSRLPFRAALRQLNVKPSECLMVGDRPDRDMKGAKGLGIKTCLARYGQGVKGKGDFEIDKFGDLLQIIEIECGGGQK